MVYLNAFIERAEELLNTPDFQPQAINPLAYELHQSVLAGEFYSEKIKFKNFYKEINGKIDETIKKLNPFSTTQVYAPLLDEELTPESKLIISQNYVAVSLIEILNNYKLLNELVEKELESFYKIETIKDSRKIFSHDIDSIVKLKINEDNFDDPRSLSDPKSGPQNTIFKINIILSEIDLNLTCNNSLEKDILKIIDYLNFIQADKKTLAIVAILIDKAYFLLYKINFRKLSLAKKEKNDYECNEYNAKMNSYRGEIKFYKYFVNKVEEHYNDGPKNLVPETEASLKKNSTTIHVEDFHYLNKEYRKKGNLDKIRELKSTLNALPKKNGNDTNMVDSSFNSISWNSIQNLTNNSIIRLVLEKEKSLNYVKTIKAFRSEGKISINYLLSDLDLYNCFPSRLESDYYGYKLMLDHIKGLISMLLDNPFKLLADGGDNLADTENIEKEINEVKEIINKIHNIILELKNVLNTSFQYCRSKRIKPVYLSYKECIVPLDKTGLEEQYLIPLFIDTAYILPDDYVKLESGIKQFNATYESEIISLKHVVTVEYNVKYFAKAFKKELELKEFKSVQVLAMFITIATLILATVKAFEGRDVISSIAIISSLSFGLILFNYFIYLFVKGKVGWGRIEWLLTFAAIVLSIVYILRTNYISKDFDNKLIKDQMKHNYRDDSAYQRKVDSIIHVLDKSGGSVNFKLTK